MRVGNARVEGLLVGAVLLGAVLFSAVLLAPRSASAQGAAPAGPTPSAGLTPSTAPQAPPPPASLPPNGAGPSGTTATGAGTGGYPPPAQGAGPAQGQPGGQQRNDPQGYARYGAPPTEPLPPEGARTHDGFFLRLGLGGGPFGGKLKRRGGSFEADLELSGVTSNFELMIGGNLARGLVLGGGLHNLSIADPNVEIDDREPETLKDLVLNISMLMLFSTYYFDDEGGLHLHAAVGFGFADFTSSERQEIDSEIEPAGGAASLGLGWEGWVADEWSLGVLGRYTVMSLTDDGGGEDPEEKFTLSARAFTLNFIATFH